MRWARHVARMGEMTTAYKILAGKSRGNRPRGKLRCRRDGNIKMNLEKWC